MSKPYETDQWCMSPYDFMDEVRAEMHLPPKVIIHDSTLRDGEQHPGVVFRKEDKIAIAEALDEYGVHRIEVMPAVSQEDADAVTEMMKLGLKAEVVGFCRSDVDDVSIAIKTGVKAAMIEVFCSPYMLSASGWVLENATDKMVKATRHAKDHGLRVTNFAVDGTRTPWDDLKKFFDTVISQGHPDAICIADTRGVMLPQATYHLVRKLKKEYDLPVEIHAHNFFGFGTADAVAAVCAGADVVHTAVNGLGEGAGNTALEEVTLALHMMLGIDMGMNFAKTYDLCKLVEKLSSVPLQSTKPLVGDKVFTTESGIAVSRLFRMKEKNIPLVPFSDSLYAEFIGRTKGVMIGKKSGRASIEYKLKELGMDVPPVEVQQKILEGVKDYSLKNKKAVPDKEFKTIVKKVLSGK